MRLKPSELGEKIYNNPIEIDNLVNKFKKCIPNLLIFSCQPSKLSLFRVLKSYDDIYKNKSEIEENDNHIISELVIKAELQGAIEQLQIEWKQLYENKEWSKSRISSLFRGKLTYEPMRNTFEVNMNIELSGGVIYNDKFLVHAISGSSGPRNIAITSSGERLKLNPYIALAAHIERNNNRAPILSNGQIFASTVPIPCMTSGLPVHVSADFQLRQGTRYLGLPIVDKNTGHHDLNNDEAILGSWNSKILQSSIEDVFLPMLTTILRKRYKHSDHPARLYRFWPTRSVLIDPKSSPRQLLADSVIFNLYEKLSKSSIFLSSSLSNVTYLKAYEGYLPLGDGSITPLVHAFAIKHRKYHIIYYYINFKKLNFSTIISNSTSSCC